MGKRLDLIKEVFNMDGWAAKAFLAACAFFIWMVIMAYALGLI
jgi:hypothetical protein